MDVIRFERHMHNESVHAQCEANTSDYKYVYMGSNHLAVACTTPIASSIATSICSGEDGGAVMTSVFVYSNKCNDVCSFTLLCPH